jgi:sigma-B regulation protein RsbQ
VRTPALVLQCSDDVIAPLAVGDYVHAHMPNSRLVVMKATGHCPNLSAPEETTRAIKDFIKALP